MKIKILVFLFESNVNNFLSIRKFNLTENPSLAY